ncbi:MAG TPA: amidohydrolase family protein [Thermoanaerobaculia bacterium]|nr:amidohydrolase family protein [Thermoanaerobaculia bacterium]
MLIAAVSAAASAAPAPKAAAGVTRAPVIDVHLHAMPASFAEGVERFTAENGQLLQLPVFDKVKAAKSDAEVLSGTIAAMKKYNVVRAVTSGPLLDQYVAALPERIIPSMITFSGKPSVEELRRELGSGKFAVLGEVASQYRGLGPDDPALDPYFAVAEELNIPVGIHMGMGGPGTPSYRAKAGNPLLLEEVLARHPRLRIYVMHAGYPMIEEMIALMHTYPQVYVDIAEIDWIRPRASFDEHLRKLVDAGLSKRVMFGSDQMAWPDAIGVAIGAVETAAYLTREQRRDILCNNAARFLKLDPALCR